ncbi:hypothetical protein A3Q56_02930 [Intoshia linei]|uniref:Protein kinase domain-containing protein n=1 Tax=Intoshia linei TaxID=1819745 RepID=A0A177B4T4_9BILA|nr:hypothetical protein A3Q56_02930 [Intoshia linei]
MIEIQRKLNIFDRYVINVRLGSGMTCKVKEAVSKETKNRYACKIIDLNECNSGEERERMIKCCSFEAKILSNFKHKNLLRVFDYYSTPTTQYLVMELCSLGELFDYMRETPNFTEKQARKFSYQIFNGVNYLHSVSIVHRDIKPENVLINSAFTLKISDLGFAAECSDNNLTEVCGSPPYFAPEIVRLPMNNYTKGYGRSVDIWSTGVVLYFMITGRLPFYKHSELAMYRSICEAKYNKTDYCYERTSDVLKQVLEEIFNTNQHTRITAENVMKHQFYLYEGIYQQNTDKQTKRIKLKSTFIAVIFCHRLCNITKKSHNVYNVPKDNASIYSVRKYRNMVDKGALKIYSHWIKRENIEAKSEFFKNSLDKVKDEIIPYIQN